jgi:RimJ/RimL family protein N-acetyltransferase
VNPSTLSAPAQWRRYPHEKAADVEAFLRDRERYCVSACSRFLSRPKTVLALTGPNDQPAALLLYIDRCLYPIFDGRQDIPLPHFLRRFLLKAKVHAVQGLTRDVETLTSAMARYGYHYSEQRDYDLMTLDGTPLPASDTPPPGLLLRAPLESDINEIYPLQTAYEESEVLLRGKTLFPAAVRANLENIFHRRRMLIACLTTQDAGSTKIVGKINTNAESFTRSQLGGVFVSPEYRKRGIGTAMIRAFCVQLDEAGRAVSLYVKKANSAARSVYYRLGFEPIGDYRITYY